MKRDFPGKIKIGDGLLHNYDNLRNQWLTKVMPTEEGTEHFFLWRRD